ncbi:hypothetical protein [Hydrogenoanaerobacterium sp.]|uniref:hypothetical protein n=1 Tax=Hydrogenoanaerobacterium sp. TaxID=2953763 RepID=UPI0028A15E76|nr:hypothetical protein [Hydrogenoanaerobacterium sp.]
MKRTIAALAAVCILLFTGCTKKPENITFTATIESISEQSIMVTTADDVGFDKASVGIADVEVNFNLFEGQTVELTIRPEIRESYPVQVTAVAIKPVE